MSKIKVDFDILDTGNPYIISLYDISNWGVIQNKVSIIEIIPPGEDVPVILSFDKKQVNVFNSNHLIDICTQGDCIAPDTVMLNDGLYQITVKGSPDKFFKKRLFLKTDTFNLELSKLFIKYYTNTSKYDFLFKYIQDIKFLVEGAKAAIRFNNISLANDLWSKAVEKLENLKNCLK